MGLKEAWKALIKKENNSKPVATDEIVKQIIEKDMFPIVKMPESKLQQYKKIPLTSLGALGTAFSRLPESARQIIQTKTTEIASKETLFVGVNPNCVSGFLRENQYGTVGNIMQVNEKGQEVIAGRMRFKSLDSIPVTETNCVTLPLDPTMVVVAVALMAIEQKMNSIQDGIEDVLHFLELEKQSRQRGNLKMLAEIADDYKNHYGDESFCNSRVQIVQQIQMSALQDVEFYQERVAEKLQKQKNAAP